MKETIEALAVITKTYTIKIEALSEGVMTAKPLPNKWSKKEVLGHLVDSGQNNLRRFICAQYEATPPFITYQQDFWVTASNYQNQPTRNIVLMWNLVNTQIQEVLRSMPVENYECMCLSDQLHSVEWLADDYVKHMKHHLNQIIANSFDVKYP